MESRRFVLGCFILLPYVLHAQLPSISSVVNAASFAGPPYDRPAEGSLATIFGQRLATAPVSAESTPLPRSLAGTTVFVEGVAVPLLYVSPSQINFQMPSDRTPGGSGPKNLALAVQTESGLSQTYRVQTAAGGPGIFTRNGSGCGEGAILNHSKQGDVSVNTRDNSAEPGGYISIYLTGLGKTYNTPPDGEPAQSSDPLARALLGGDVNIGLPDSTFSESVLGAGTTLFAGRAPGLVGVDQVTAKLPENAPEGCAVPIMVTTSILRSQPVTMSIRTGGGTCADPPTVRNGSLAVRRVRNSGPDSAARTDSFQIGGTFEELTASLFRRRPTGRRTADAVATCLLRHQGRAVRGPVQGP